MGVRTVRVGVIIPVQTYELLGRRNVPGLIARTSLWVIPGFCCDCDEGNPWVMDCSRKASFHILRSIIDQLVEPVAETFKWNCRSYTTQQKLGWSAVGNPKDLEYDAVFYWTELPCILHRTEPIPLYLALWCASVLFVTVVFASIVIRWCQRIWQEPTKSPLCIVFTNLIGALS